MRQLTFLWKDRTGTEGDCIGGDCPALYRVDGGYVVQGTKLTDDERAQLRHISTAEDAVFVPDNVLDRLREL